MQKRRVHKRFVLLAILMALALVALIGGSFVLSSAYAANHGSLQEVGFPVEGVPSQKPWGEYTFTVHDPDGHVLEFDDSHGV